ncbi:MAG: agmatine deiminase family protein [Bdellovibrionales bacterium]|nr:agmatine deiminase family protein [Bdellovibrionales bacterium]
MSTHLTECRLPAEWENHATTWIGWPHQSTDWPGKLPAVMWAYGEIVRILTGPGREHVSIFVNDKAHEKKAAAVLTKAGVGTHAVSFVRLSTDRGWLRDSGAIFVEEKGKLLANQFAFNAWAKYPNWKKDAKVPAKIASHEKLLIRRVLHDKKPVVLEGGAIDYNGAHTLLTTEECLLDEHIQVRNPGFTREDYESLFAEYLGTRKTLWLGKGIVGDDTHGHVDDLCRFVNRNTVVLVREQNPQDDNYRPLEENFERLQGATTADGEKLNVVSLPMPSPLHFSGYRLPASYANFYIANGAVLVPTFNDEKDRDALGILSELFDRPVVGLHAVDLVWGFGTLHCLTHEQPSLA